jgi:hypothetical protein
VSSDVSGERVFSSFLQVGRPLRYGAGVRALKAGILVQVAQLDPQDQMATSLTRGTDFEHRKNRRSRERRAA